MDGRDLCGHGVDFALQMGAEYAEARYEKILTEGYSMRNGEILSAGKKEQEGIGIRIIVEGSLGFCSIDGLDKGELEQSIEEAHRMASSYTRREPVRFSKEDVHEDSWETRVAIPFHDVDQETKVDFLTDIDKSMDPEENGLALRNLSLKTVNRIKHLTTSEGCDIQGSKSLFSLGVMFQAEHNGHSEQRHFSIGGAGGWEWAEDEDLRERIADDATRTSRVVSEAKSMELGEIDVVVGPEVAGIMAHENCGHPSEGDRIKGREAAQAGESWYSDLVIGESQIGSEALTIIDDPTIRGSAGFYPYDDEGVRARPRYLIKKGILNELLLNREFAYRFDTKSTAAARSTGYEREPIIRMANTYIAPGDHSQEELVEDIDKGIFMSSFTEWNIDDRRFQSKYVGSHALLIENGNLTEKLVRRPVLELTTRRLFRSIDACGTGFKADLATCGKSDPMQGIPVWTGGPCAVRLRNVRVGVGI